MGTMTEIGKKSVCENVGSSSSGCEAGMVESKEGKSNKQFGWSNALEDQLEHLGKGTTWMAVILGQVLSVLLCVSAFSSVQLVETYEIQTPNAQNFVFYMILATLFTTTLACRPAERNLFPILRSRGWKYVLVALIDTESKYLVSKAYQLTSETSVQLLDCFAIPTVLSLSWIMLKIRLNVPHIFGVSICLLGVSCLVWADIEDGRLNEPSKDIFMGDMLCLAAAFLLGISNIAQEFVVKTFDAVEFLGMIGLFGSFFSGAQTLLLEYTTVTALNWSDTLNTQPIILLVTYASSQAAFYMLSTFVIKWSSATFLNLSLLSADFYSLIISIYLLRVKFHALYFLSYVLVMTGVITFSIKPTILGSHVYKSLTREHTHTTTLDLELMSSSPSSVGFLASGSYHHHCCSNEQKHEEIRVGGPGSLLTSEKSQLRNIPPQSNSPMLSNEGCDVVLQTTTNLRIRSGQTSTYIHQGAKDVRSVITEEDDC